jgi:N-acetylmuramoyl-L-alanine amidase
MLFIIDPGHGGILNGKNMSKDGKYSPRFTDGTKFHYKGASYDRFYEGANNRILAKEIIDHLTLLKFDAVDITSGSELDVPPINRVSGANKLVREDKCVYISIHSDATGFGETWEPANGISVYTSKGQTGSDIFAAITIDCLQEAFGVIGKKFEVKWRTDITDGDKDKEENFYVLRKTVCDSILIEGGFHTNLSEVKEMMTADWRRCIVDAIGHAAIKYAKLHS